MARKSGKMRAPFACFGIALSFGERTPHTFGNVRWTLGSFASHDVLIVAEGSVFEIPYFNSVVFPF